MSAATHQVLADIAEQLISANGRDIEVIVRSNTLQNPSQPWLGTQDSETTQTVRGVVLDNDHTFIGDTAISEEEQLVLVSPEDLTGITPDDVTDLEIQDLGKRFKVRRVNTLQPGQVVMLFEFVVGA